MLDLNPMLCRQVREPFDRPGWIFEVKWDGFRTIAEVDGDGVRLYSRRLNSFNGRFSQIAKSLEGLGHNAILDGEIVALDEEGHPRFEWLFHRGKDGKGQLVYFVFDLLYLDGNDLRREPLHRRKSRLKRIIRKIPHLVYVDHIERARQRTLCSCFKAWPGRNRGEGQAKSLCGRKRDAGLAED